MHLARCNWFANSAAQIVVSDICFGGFTVMDILPATFFLRSYCEGHFRCKCIWWGATGLKIPRNKCCLRNLFFGRLLWWTFRVALALPSSCGGLQLFLAGCWSLGFSRFRFVRSWFSVLGILTETERAWSQESGPDSINCALMPKQCLQWHNYLKAVCNIFHIFYIV